MVRETFKLGAKELKEMMAAVYSESRDGLLKEKHVADAVVFLASQDSAFVTGHNFVVDGGFGTKLRKLLMQEEEDAVTRNRQRALVMQAASSHILRIQEEESQWGGSQPGRQYIARDREAMDRRLKDLYFTSPCRFQGDIFRKRYRMRPHVFDQMMHDVANHNPYFVQTDDATGRVGLSTEQKLTCAMRMLAYGLPADLCDEFLDVAESTALEILSHLLEQSGMCTTIITFVDQLRQICSGCSMLLRKGGSPEWWEVSIVCTGSGKTAHPHGKGTLLVIRENPQSFWRRSHHTMLGFGTPISDFQVPLMILMYLECLHYSTKYAQESYRKDVERAFGILQARFAIVRGPARGWDREDLSYIMMTCIILHNMIVDDEREEDEESPFDPDDIPTRPRKAQIYERYEDDNEVERNRPELEEFMTRYQGVRCPIVHRVLQGDLVNHLWNMKLQAERNRR
ncbi:uncharacterized protein LOC112178464 [Rosa chinensis]|uniref:uncharacterized protein LOC112178464 n=1 Tax=Rosa chinensis TaxID=74649 RepID=UPI000D0931CE|nr:uncharacterized protein LOC112178464 [Rosa chinensis]